MTEAEFEAWCAAVPGLWKTGPWSWALHDPARVSFPPQGHDLLAAIEEKSYWFAHRNHVIAAAVRNFPPAGPIFDVGGGNGFVSLGLQKDGQACVVIEPGVSGAANARARGLPVVQAAFEQLSLPDSCMAAAGMFDVLEHIEDDHAALAGVHRVLAPEGRLYLAVPAHGALWSNEDRIAGHFRRYSLGKLRRKLDQAGFTVEYDTYFFSALIAPIFLLRTLPNAAGIRSKQALEKAAGQHHLPPGLAGRYLAHSFARELQIIARGGRKRIGASCLVVARRR